MFTKALTAAFLLVSTVEAQWTQGGGATGWGAWRPPTPCEPEADFRAKCVDCAMVADPDTYPCHAGINCYTDWWNPKCQAWSYKCTPMQQNQTGQGRPATGGFVNSGFGQNRFGGQNQMGGQFGQQPNPWGTQTSGPQNCKWEKDYCAWTVARHPFFARQLYAPTKNFLWTEFWGAVSQDCELLRAEVLKTATPAD